MDDFEGFSVTHLPNGDFEVTSNCEDAINRQLLDELRNLRWSASQRYDYNTVAIADDAIAAILNKESRKGSL